MNRPNPSYSKTFLTRKNYRGPTLLRTVLGRNTALAFASDSGINTDKESAVMQKRRTEDDLEAIYGPPASSDDEDSNPDLETKAGFPLQTTKSPTRSPPKRPATTAATSRSKRRKLKDRDSIDMIDVANPPDIQDAWLGSQNSQKGSQKRKLKQTYAGRKCFEKPEAVDMVEEKPSLKQKFVSYEEIEKPGNGLKIRGDYIGVAPLPENLSTKAASRPNKALDIADLPQALRTRKDTDFRMPELPDITSSATTSATDILSVFEDALSSNSKRQRSGSTSSLSSVDSMFILENEADMNEQIEPVEDRVRCPVCQRVVHDSISLYIPENLRSLSFKQQQNFCSQHQVADAKELWEQRCYPDVDWEELEKSRIPAHLHSLKKLINRQTSSVYLDELDKKVKAAKGNQKAIRQYLREGVVEVAKPGYYGPKGTRIMVTAITEALTETLKEALQSDAVLRTAGVGGYVSAVLVPALTLRLVMEDMLLADDDVVEGRRVLEESTNIGVLLNPDDDHIEREDDD
ncbi:hypothetical protein LTR06_005825 [Exophiala xenobiotica]|nr:hypothetical protein LTR06_005825 [Exophiala xenobiotica]KAK5442086.1 hypothetical protein LTR18_005938 [Exophiala xenobiotica]